MLCTADFTQCNDRPRRRPVEDLRSVRSGTKLTIESMSAPPSTATSMRHVKSADCSIESVSPNGIGICNVERRLKQEGECDVRGCTSPRSRIASQIGNRQIHPYGWAQNAHYRVNMMCGKPLLGIFAKLLCKAECAASLQRCCSLTILCKRRCLGTSLLRPFQRLLSAIHASRVRIEWSVGDVE